MATARIKKARLKVPQLTLSRAALFDILEERMEGALRYGYMRAHKHGTPPAEQLEERIIEEQMREVMNKFYDLFAEDEPDVDDGR